MIQLPPVPSWDGLHPLVVHFPIALLIVAPLFVVLGLVLAGKVRGLLVAALVLMALGTAGTWVAVSTGEAAGKLADRSPQINPVIEHHEELAERTRLVFSVLTVVFAGLLFGPRVLKRDLRDSVSAVLLVFFLLVYGAGTIVLANTAHNGGRLVHELGVHSLMPPPPATSAGVAGDDD